MALAIPVGEPYRLGGNRIPFMSWRYVRPGTFGWFDAKGNNVSVHGDLEWGQAKLVLNDSPRGVHLIVNTAVHFGPVLRAEEPWEKDGYPILTTVMQEGNRYRAWGSVGGWGDLKDRGPEYFCYFESDDGVQWRRPRYGIIEVSGNRDNNVIESEGGTVFIDPSAPPRERYKWVTLATFSAKELEAYKKIRQCGIDAKVTRQDMGDKIWGIKGATSPDGLHWNVLPHPLALIFSDTQIVACFDTALSKYVIYTREWAADPVAPGFENDTQASRWKSIGRRSIGRAESPDFREFPLSTTILEPPLWLPPTQVLYSPVYTKFPGAPDQHVMFPLVWDMSTDRMHTRIAVSRDGITWDWLGVTEAPPLEMSEQGKWDGGCLGCAPNLIELPDGDFAVPYVGYDVPHKYPRRRAKRATGYARWNKGRIAGIRADERGEFATIAVVPPGRKVLLNAVAESGGSISVEAADLDGRSLPGRSFEQAIPLKGDLHREPVVWKEHSDLPSADPVILRFKLDRATVYFVEFV